MEFGQNGHPSLLPNSFPIAVNSQITENELGNRERVEFGQNGHPSLLPNSFPITVNSQIRENELDNREWVWNSARMATLLYYLIRSEHRLHRKSEEEQSILVDKGRLLSDLIHSTLSKIETVAGKKLRAGKSWSSARSSRPFLTLKSFSSKTAPVKLAHLQAHLRL